jgi:hypothetical protein
MMVLKPVVTHYEKISLIMRQVRGYKMSTSILHAQSDLSCREKKVY